MEEKQGDEHQRDEASEKVPAALMFAADAEAAGVVKVMVVEGTYLWGGREATDLSHALERMR